MDSLVVLVHQHADLAPWIVFGLLLLAGFNVPISEDAVIFGSALIASERVDLLVPLLVALYSGAVLGDLVCYGIGRRFGPRLWKLQVFERLVPWRHVQGLGRFYQRYGVAVLLVGRFVPFGVRNALLLTAGLGRLPFLRLVGVDLVAAMGSCGASFFLYLTYGRAALELVARSQVGLAVLVGVVVLALVARKLLLRRLDR